MKDVLQKIADSCNGLLKAQELNVELLNTVEQLLFSIQVFCLKHNIPFDEEKIQGSIAKIECLLDELNLSKSQQTKAYMDKKTDEDFTEPAIVNYFSLLKNQTLTRFRDLCFYGFGEEYGSA